MKTVVIYDFMIRDLKLKGFELLFFAIIYSFSQFGSNLYAKVSTICDFLQCSRSQFFACRRSLISKNLIMFIDNTYFLLDFSEPLLGQKLPDNPDELKELSRLASISWVD